MQLTPVPLRLELNGRLRNISKLKHWQMAVAEAVKNAMDAISESGQRGAITIEVKRETLGNFIIEDDLPPIKSITVRDNGVGFNAENYQSFCTPDSLRKQKYGGKGLGRLTCLQAFNRVRVQSVFRDNGSWKERNILFQCEQPELSSELNDAQSTASSTLVHLENLRPEFEAGSRMTFDSLAEWLGEHFLPSLVERPKWLESLTLVDGKDRIDLTLVIEGGAEWIQKFSIRGYEFRTVCYSLNSEGKADMVRLVAGSRIVHANTQPLDFYLPHLEKIAEDKSHVVLIYSPFFDEHVNDARNGVSFAEKGDGTLLGVTAPEFREACANAFRESLGNHIEKSNDKFKERIKQVVSKEAPYYKPLLMGFFDGKEFTNLSAGSSDEEILSALDTFKRRDAQKMKQESRRMARLKTEEEGYWERAEKLALQIETQKKVALAEYVTLRKLVLERLAEILEVNDEGKAHKESAIHNLIFPQRSDTETNPGADHQLWILDERFESHVYLSSDKPMDGKTGDRPDLMIALDHPGAFADEASSSSGYNKMVLVEFKRSLTDLNTVPTDDLPHQQMIRYARQIAQEKALHLKSRRPIKVSSDVRFYMYAVCELSKTFLDRLVETAGFTPSPTGDGAFLVTNQGKYYIEYISLPKMLEDSQARNAAFFRKLGLEA